MLRELAGEHEFTVFAVEFENPCAERIRWIRIPAPCRPLALLFVVFHLLAPLAYLIYRLRGGAKFDVIQMVESNLSFGDLVYSHFCHRTYLKHYWKQSRVSGLRASLRWLDHRLHALVEGWVYGRARCIVTPSRGLSRELVREFSSVDSRLHVLPNAVEVEKLKRPVHFDRDGFRQKLGIERKDLALVFAALGQFERKGLPLLLDALASIKSDALKLIVVGGEPDLIAAYRERAGRADLGHRVRFVGMQSDVRPYFWAADAFVFPSYYETFSLVTFEAAAAGLPLIVPELNGVEEILRHGENGFLVARNVEEIAAALELLFRLPLEERLAMGRRAQLQARSYCEANFVKAWREVYQQWFPGKSSARSFEENALGAGVMAEKH